MTKRDALDDTLVLSANADPLDDLFDHPEGRTAARKPRPAPRSSGGGASAFLIAGLASFVWIAAVAAFCWSRYSLPDNPGDAIDVVGSRISTGDWMLIAAAILGPLALIWTIAWLMRRTAELKRQSQELATVALRLTQAAQTAEAAGRPLALSGGSADLADETPRHLRREVERATHAISALHSQMSAIEEALSSQARNIDDVAERAEKRARTIASTLRTEREALERASAAHSRETGGGMDISPAALGAVGTGLAGAGAVALSTMGDERVELEPSLDAPAPLDTLVASDATDFALDEARVKAAANSDAADLLTDAPTFARDDAPEVEVENDIPAAPSPADNRTNDDDIAILRERLAEARNNASWDRPVLSEAEREALDSPDLSGEIAAETLDPFDDLDTSLVKEDDRLAIGGVATATAVTGIAAATLDTDAPDTYDAQDNAIGDEHPPLKLERRHSIDWKKFTRAANFPESEDDIETLDALYDVLTDPEAASLLQCAEDTLASLADIDLYMEDYAPRLMPVTAWKSHLDGSGGEVITGINAPVEQSRIRAKLNSDKGFEHLSAKFMDRYEEMGRRLMGEAEEQKLIVDLSNTRTGRAYLMIAEPAGRLSA